MLKFVVVAFPWAIPSNGQGLPLVHEPAAYRLGTGEWGKTWAIPSNGRQVLAAYRLRTPRCVLAFGFERGKLSLDLGFTGEHGEKWEWEERMEKIITCGVIF